MKIRKEIANNQGITLGELIEFVASCSAAEMPLAAVPEVRVGFRGQMKRLTIEAEKRTGRSG